MDQDNAVAEHEAGQLERLTFFSDAVFAIAMTLLVIEIRLPHAEAWTDAALTHALLELLPHYIGFLVSFVVIGRFWVAHHQVFGMLMRSDARLLWSNLFMLLCVAFMPFATAVLSEHSGLTAALVFYTGWLTIMGLVHIRLVRVALGRGGNGPLVNPAIPEAARRYWLRGSFISPIIGLVAMAGSLIAPWVGMLLLILGSPVVTFLLRRGAPALPDDQASSSSA